MDLAQDILTKLEEYKKTGSEKCLRNVFSCQKNC